MTEYRVGDKIRVTDVAEYIVTSVDDEYIRCGGFVVRVSNGEERGYNGWTRTIEVIERAPVPWQAGDIAITGTGTIVIRQATGSWVNWRGDVTSLADEFVTANYDGVVRGGKRVAS